MGALLGLLLVLGIATAPEGRLLLSADDRVEVGCLEGEPFTPVAFYLLAELDTAGLIGWQAQLQWPPQVTILTWSVLPPTAVDRDPSMSGFEVDTGAVVGGGSTPVALLRVWAAVFQPEVGDGGFQLGPDPTWIDTNNVEHGFARWPDGSGSPGSELGLRCATPATAHSWGTMKSRFAINPRTR